MIAHVVGMPAEELLLPVLFGAGALYASVSALIARRRRVR
jgi:hypothetical protein